MCFSSREGRSGSARPRRGTRRRSGREGRVASPRAPRRRSGHTRVFVYGTLRVGQGNHHLLASSRMIGLDRTLARYTLVDLGAFPAVVVGGATAVVGEVFEVDAATLARLDRLEGHPRFYQRTTVRLASGRRAEMYVMALGEGRPRRPIDGGDRLARGATRR